MEKGIMEEGRVNLKSPHLPSLQLTSGIEGWKGVEKGIMEEGRVNREYSIFHLHNLHQE